MSPQAGAASRSPPTRGRRTIREPSHLAAASIRWCVGGRPRRAAAAGRRDRPPLAAPVRGGPSEPAVTGPEAVP
ncbi:MAG: hypothetical protein ACJ786_38550 [Catenulispora sp.]